ncbi:co-regulatory protein PtrA N-terminal domain-containing protein [Pseudomonas sp. TMP9]
MKSIKTLLVPAALSGANVTMAEGGADLTYLRPHGASP